MRRLLVSFSLLVFAAQASPVWGVIIFEKGKDQPIIGYLERQDDNLVVVRQLLPNGQTQLRELPRSEIDDILIAVSDERLQTLSPDKPAAYRDYAEELAEKRKDPDARATGLRLYLLAAHLDPEKLGRSSLLGMAGLARSPAEERRFRAMAYLLDPNHDRNLLQDSAKNAGPEGSEDDEGNGVLLKAMRSFRRGKRATAITMASRPVAQKAFARFSEVLTLEELKAVKKKEVPPDILRKVLALELILASGETATRDEDPDDMAPWSRIVEREGTGPVPSLSLESLTEFDPRECVFSDGKWGRPKQAGHGPAAKTNR